MAQPWHGSSWHLLGIHWGGNLVPQYERSTLCENATQQCLSAIFFYYSVLSLCSVLSGFYSTRAVFTVLEYLFSSVILKLKREPESPRLCL